MDDIVTRLRGWEKPTVTQDDILDLRQAADEIERLRADRDKWFHLARRLYVQHGKRAREISELAEVLAIYEQAVRGE